MKEDNSRDPTTEERDAINLMEPQKDCKPGNVRCPYYSKVSSMWTFCLRNGKDCTCGGNVSLNAPLSIDDYRNSLKRIVTAWNNDETELHAALVKAAKMLNIKLTEKKGNSK